MEWHCVGSQLRPTDPHEVESLGVQDVEATAPIHQDFSESGITDDGDDDKWVVPQVQDVIRVVVTAKRDGLLGPIEEQQGGGFCRVDLSAFALSLARRELRRATTEDHEAVLHLGEPFVLAITLLGIYYFLLGIVLGLTAP
jgi:hypothetical protein